MRIIALTLLISFSSQAVISQFCSLLFKRGMGKGMKSDLKRLDTINRLDGISSFLRSMKSNRELVEINQHIMGKVARVDNQLFQGRFAFAHRQWRGLFRRVEVNYAFVKKQQEVVDVVRKMIDQGLPVSKMKEQIADKLDDPFYKELNDNLKNAGTVDKYLRRADKEIRKRHVTIGNNYHEYKLVRSHLETLSKNANCKADCDKAVLQLLETLGTGAENVRLHYPNILKGSKRPSMKVIKDYVHKTPIIYETRLLKEMLFELKAFVREFVMQSHNFRALMKFIERKFPLKKSKIMRIFNIVNDGVARTEHFPNINSVVRKNSSIDEKYAFLRDLNTKFERDEMLVSFSRRVDTQATETWSEIKTFLKSSDDAKKLDFLKRMELADEKAKVLGDLSLNSTKSNINKISILIGAGTTGVIYLNYGIDKVEEGSSQVIQVIDDVTNNQNEEDGVTTIVVQEDDNVVIEQIIETSAPSGDGVDNNVIEVQLTEQEVDTLYSDTLDFHEVMRLYEEEINAIQEK